MEPLRVLLVDDHEVVRMGLRMLLEAQTTVRIVGEAGTAEDAVRLCGATRAEVVILDIRMPPGVSGIEACRQIVERWPQTKVIMLTSYADDSLIADAIQAGAVGYVLKQADTGDLLRALEAVRRGEALLDPEITRRVLAMMRRKESPAPDPFAGLTARELDVLRLLSEGHTNADIARLLVLSEKTVRNHLTIIFDKLNTANRVEAATYAVEHDIRHYRRSG
jgi:DNA-binding NarL/FixJ family response regulator